MRSKKAIYNISFSLLLQIIIIICGFIVPKLIISTYGSSVNGLITSITQFLGYITLLEAGFGQVIKSILYKPIANKNKKEIEQILKASEKIFKRISYVFIIYIIILCIVLPIILNNDFDKLFTLSLIIIISISTFFEYYFGMTYRLYLQAKQNNYVISIIQISTLILNTIIIIILIKLKFNIQIVKLFSAMIFILRPILQNIYVKKKYNIYLKNIDSNYKIKQKWDGLAQHIAYVIHTNTDILILTLFCNLKEVSVYSIYYLILNNIKNIICNTFINSVDSAFGDMIAKNEKDKLNNSFKTYEGLYLTISTIIFICTFILIVPFVKVYTKGITDANYIRPLFASILTLAEFIFVIRQLYYSLVKVSGHFKQTKKGAIIEASINIVISLSLVFKFGIIGVAIGTLVAMLIRTIEIIIYTSKNILNRKLSCAIKRIILIIVEFIIIILINRFIKIDINSYITWLSKGIIIFIISSSVIILINSIFNKDILVKIKSKIKIIIKKIVFRIKYGKDVVIFSLGENCMTDDLLNRNDIKSFSSPYSSGRSNIEYILYFEKEKFKDFLNSDYLKYEMYNDKKVVRNKKIKKLNNKYNISVTNGFEFTHHDVINNIKDNKNMKKRCYRLLNLKNKKIYMLYHHRLCNDTNQDLLINHLQELSKIYKERNNIVNIYIFTQIIVSKASERRVEKYKLKNGIYKYYFYTLKEWKGNNYNVFYGICDDDLLNEMINDIKSEITKKY